MLLQHEYLTNDIYNSLPKEFIETYARIYKKELSDNLKEVELEIKCMIDNQLDNIIKETQTKNKTAKSLFTYNKKIFKKQKKRWFEYAIKEVEQQNSKRNYKYILKKIQLMEDYVDLIGREKASKEIIDVLENKEEYIKKYINELHNWLMDDTALLYTFEYLKFLSDKQIQSAFEQSLNYYILKKIIEDYNGCIQTYITAQPNILFYPIFSLKPKQIKLNELTPYEKDEMSYMYKQEYANLIIRTIVDSTKINLGNKKITNFKQLNIKDLKLFNTILSFRGKDFIEKKEIKVYFDDLLKALNKERGGMTYNTLVNDLNRLKYFSVDLELQNYDERSRPDYLYINFIESLEISKDSSKKRYVLIKLSDAISKQLLKNDTTRIYSKQINMLKLDISQALIYKLQKDRINCYVNNIPYEKIYTYENIKSNISIQLPYKSKKSNLELISDSLSEFKSLNIIVENFIQKNDEFLVFFYSLTQHEINNFVLSKSKEEKEEVNEIKLLC